MTSDASPPFLPRVDFATWSIYTPQGVDAVTRARRGMQVYFWWVAHALFAGDPVAIPSLRGNPVPQINGLVLVEKPGIYRIELLGPASVAGRPRTGAPIATIYSFFDAAGPGLVLAAEWKKIQAEYGAPGQAPLPGRGFIVVIKHKYVTLGAGAAQAVAVLSDYLGYAAFAHSTGEFPPDSSRRPYLSAMPVDDLSGRLHLQRLPTAEGRPATARA